MSLHSEEEDRFVAGLKSGERIWLLGRKTGGQWQWDDGTPWDYQNWGPGSPSGDGNCLEAWNRNGGEWNDRGCTNIAHDMYFVCRKHSEFSSPSTIEPTTTKPPAPTEGKSPFASPFLRTPKVP